MFAYTEREKGDLMSRQERLAALVKADETTGKEPQLPQQGAPTGMEPELPGKRKEETRKKIREMVERHNKWVGDRFMGEQEPYSLKESQDQISLIGPAKTNLKVRLRPDGKLDYLSHKGNLEEGLNPALIMRGKGQDWRVLDTGDLDKMLEYGIQGWKDRFTGEEDE